MRVVFPLVAAGALAVLLCGCVSAKINVVDERTAPFWVRWTPGDGDYMVFKLSPGDGSDTPWGALRCITFDDGCLEVPGAALGQLALDKATNFRLRLERHQVVSWSEEVDGLTKAAAIVDVSAVLEGTVGR